MEGFDFAALLQKYGKRDNQHKSKPAQFTSVAKGRSKRIETTMKRRRTSRFSIFDKMRDLPQNSPAKRGTKQEALKQKIEHRKIQLEKYKQEKEKRKKEAAAHKKKPFVVGIARPPPKLGPVPNVLPSTSGRVTRSQTAKSKGPFNDKSDSSIKTKKSFAPENASFVPPKIKGMEQLPPLVLPSNKKKTKVLVQFKPVITEVDKKKETIIKPSSSKILKGSQFKKETKAVEIAKKVGSRIPKNNPSRSEKSSSEASAQSQESEVESAQKTKAYKKFSNNHQSVLEKFPTPGTSQSSDSCSPDGTKATAGSAKIPSCGKRMSHRPKNTEIISVNNKTRAQGKKNQCDTKSISVNSSSEDNLDCPNKVRTRKSMNMKKSSGDSKVSTSVGRNKYVQIPSVEYISISDSSLDSPVLKKTTRKSTTSLLKQTPVEQINSSLEKLPSKKYSPGEKPYLPKNLPGPLLLQSNRNCNNQIENSSESHVNSQIVKKSERISKVPSTTCTPLKQITQNTEMTPSKPHLKDASNSKEKSFSPKESPLTPEQITELAKNMSPCITMSRGKDNARRELQKKLREGKLDEHLEALDSVDRFHRQLNTETNRLIEMADHWEKMMEQNTLPEFVQEGILGAVGQARLLVSQKFQQFAGLIDRCEAPDPSQPLVTPVDLQGFWDMVYMQVENVDMRFKKLEEMQSRGWVGEEQPARRRIKGPKGTARPVATSRIKDMIAAARQAKKNSEANVSEADGSKTFEAGFFSVKTPVKSPLTASTTKLPQTTVTPNKPTTLLKAVLSSEAKKASASKMAASYAMLRASMIGKNVDQDYDFADNMIQFTPVNLKATPSRSILKSSTARSNKSIKTVLFNSSDTNILDYSLDKDISGVQTLDSEDSSDSQSTLSSKKVRQFTHNNENIDANNDLSLILKSPQEKKDSSSLEHTSPNNKVSSQPKGSCCEDIDSYKENYDERQLDSLIEKENTMSTRKESGKPKRSKKIVRQDAITSPVRTRSRKSETPRYNVLQDSVNTPRRSLRRKTLASNV